MYFSCLFESVKNEIKAKNFWQSFTAVILPLNFLRLSMKIFLNLNRILQSKRYLIKVSLDTYQDIFKFLIIKLSARHSKNTKSLTYKKFQTVKLKEF